MYYSTLFYHMHRALHTSRMCTTHRKWTASLSANLYLSVQPKKVPKVSGLQSFFWDQKLCLLESQGSFCQTVCPNKFGHPARCLITEKVSFNIASEASYIYILSGRKLIKNAKNGPFWQVFENLKLTVKQCYQTGQF